MKNSPSPLDIPQPARTKEQIRAAKFALIPALLFYYGLSTLLAFSYNAAYAVIGLVDVGVLLGVVLYWRWLQFQRSLLHYQELAQQKSQSHFPGGK